jgi:hypothetical protein
MGHFNDSPNTAAAWFSAGGFHDSAREPKPTPPPATAPQTAIVERWDPQLRKFVAHVVEISREAV